MAYEKLLTTIFILPFIFGGGSSSSENPVLARALDDIRPALIQMDKRYALYEGALKAAEAYIDSPGTDSLEAAKNNCMDAIAEISDLPSPQSTLTADERVALMNLGINMSDYDVPFTSVNSWKYRDIQVLTLISYYLDNAPELRKIDGEVALKCSVPYYLREQDLTRKIFAAGVNHLFCEFSESELGDFKTDFLPSLSTLSADALPWETDKAVLQAKVDYWFSEMEADVTDFSEFAGSEYLAILEMQAQLKDSLIAAGYSAEEADERIADTIDKGRQALTSE